jgi:hypothetical protein
MNIRLNATPDPTNAEWRLKGGGSRGSWSRPCPVPYPPPAIVLPASDLQPRRKKPPPHHPSNLQRDCANWKMAILMAMPLLIRLNPRMQRL